MKSDPGRRLGRPTKDVHPKTGVLPIETGFGRLLEGLHGQGTLRDHPPVGRMRMSQASIQ